MQPHQLKDTVSRALSGKLLSRPALELFIAAFEFTAEEADRLRKLWNGNGSIRVLSGSHALAPHAEQSISDAFGPRRHQTLTMHDHVHVDADGRIARARTLQVIEASVPETDRIPYLYDTCSLTVEAGEGCAGCPETCASSPAAVRHRDPAGPAAGLGETTTIEYTTTFQYPGNPSRPARAEYRRGVMGSLENFDLRIQFHPGRLPAGVWWATWDGIDGPLLTQEPVQLDSLHAAQRYLRSVQRTVVGFHWAW